VHTFSENLRRLLGLHDLRGREAARMIGVSPQSLSEWMRGRRHPNLQMLLRVSSFLEIASDRLLQANFRDLLERELKDPARFDRVEAKILKRRGRATRRPRRAAG
jgi:transcriptional regulator with XRE-family HTH domain